MHTSHATFSTGQVVAATGVAHESLQNWLKRGLVVGQKDIEGGGAKGRHRRYSFFNVIEIAMAKALIDAGMSTLEHAFYAAALFSHTGVGGRIPSHPFNQRPGYTLLVAGPGWADTFFLSPDTKALELYAALVPQGRIGATFINASRVFDNVCGRLMEITGDKQFHPEAVLEAAYSKAGEG